jgi:hypothetical protein
MADGLWGQACSGLPRPNPQVASGAVPDDHDRSPTDLAVSRQREANVAYANALMDTEIGQRNARKDSQEATARWIVASTGIVMTLLLGLAKDEGVFSSSASVLARVALVATVALGSLAAGCAIGCLWPRPYDRLGAKGLVNLNDTAFLDKPEHEVMGQVVATRIAIATKMDELHEDKASWLKWSFRFLACAFVGLVLQGAVLAISPPKSPSERTANIQIGAKAAQLAPTLSRGPRSATASKR